MARMVVSCAGCGNKYRGEGDGKQVACVACNNTITFPGGPRTASPGKLLCSCCWTEMVVRDKSERCPVCEQRILRAWGGLAVLEAQPGARKGTRRRKPEGEHRGDPAAHTHATPHTPHHGEAHTPHHGEAHAPPRHETPSAGFSDVRHEAPSSAYLPRHPHGTSASQPPAAAPDTSDAHLRARVAELETEVMRLQAMLEAERSHGAGLRTSHGLPLTADPDNETVVLRATLMAQIEEMTRGYQFALKRLAEEVQELFARSHLARKRLEGEAEALGLNVTGLASALSDQIEAEVAALDDRLVHLRSMPLRASAMPPNLLGTDSTFDPNQIPNDSALPHEKHREHPAH